MKNELTVIIVFLNEGIEIQRTVDSIRRTAGDSVEILLVNDACTDGYDYASVADKYHARYHINKQRLGPAASRDLGISLIDTPYFLLLDGHMRLYDNNWWNVIVARLRHNERAVYCCQCKVLDRDFEIMRDRDTFGAHIHFVENREILDAVWHAGNDGRSADTMDISCILGACYAASRNYWNYLGGYKGLVGYGSEEPYISIKVWLEGGQCILLKQLEMGHVFRDTFPYPVYMQDNIYNKLMIAETLLPTDLKTQIFSLLRKENGSIFEEAFEMLLQNRKQISELKMYYKQIFTRSIDQFIEYNQSFIKH